MKLREKIKTLLQSGRPRGSKRSGGQSASIVERPTPMKDYALPLDPAKGWGLVLEPVVERDRLVNDFIEQLALEAYLNGEGFIFSDQELSVRFLSYFDRLVHEGVLERKETDAILPEERSEIWIQAQQLRIERLVTWWRAHGGPDIEPRIL